MKIFISLLLTAILFAGCQGASTNHIQEEMTKSPLVAQDVQPQNPLISYDANREFYCTWNNLSKDIYMNNRIYVEEVCTIFSTVYVEPEEIEITIPIETDYYIQVQENSAVRSTTYLESLKQQEDELATAEEKWAFPYELYMAYRDMDWEELYRLYKEAQEAKECLQYMISLPVTDPEKARLMEIENAYKTYKEVYRADYEALTPEDLPVFYCYDVVIYFGPDSDLLDYEGISYEKEPKQVSESFHTMEIKLGDKMYMQDVGEIRLHAEDLSEEVGLYQSKGIKRLTNAIFGTYQYPWGDGVVRGSEWYFGALEELTIQKAYLYENVSQLELIGAHVKISSEPSLMTFEEMPKCEENILLDFYWDLKTPITVKAGAYVTIELFWKDPLLTQLEYATNCFPIFEYRIEGEVYQTATMAQIQQDTTEDWFTYSIAFEGMDLEAYCDYYRRTNDGETWREELPW